MLPHHPVQVGDTWTREIPFPTRIGKGTMKADSVLLRKFQGRRLYGISRSARGWPGDVTMDVPLDNPYLAGAKMAW